MAKNSPSKILRDARKMADNDYGRMNKYTSPAFK
jgi:hypothetical protein